MYTSGHTQILLKAIKLYYYMHILNKSVDLTDEKRVFAQLKSVPAKTAKVQFKAALKAFDLPFVTFKQLKTGLKYPDFPCGKYELTPEGKLNFKQKLCSLLRVVDDISFFPDIFSVSYSSHNGYFSLWHAMTFDPSQNDKQIQAEILNQILSFCKLSLVDDTLTAGSQPNTFWLGMALHTIMDAYSPAHVLRKSSIQQHKVVNIKPLSLTSKEDRHIQLFKELKENLNQVSKSLDKEDKSFVDGIVQTLCLKYNIKTNKDQSQLRRLADFFYFQNFQVHTVSNLIKSKSRNVRKSIGIKSNLLTYQKIKVVKFYYYPSQDALFHKKNDMIRAAKENKLYFPAIIDTYHLINTYLTTLGGINQRITKDDVASFLKVVDHHLKTYTLALEKTKS